MEAELKNGGELHNVCSGASHTSNYQRVISPKAVGAFVTLRGYTNFVLCMWEGLTIRERRTELDGC